ncbi:hypothetical protein [Pandoraea sputorum]|uniref:hypothetical protein n=1 Tax=Pandoraea sputorum TaxID=93222 RepID=UPI003558C17D
MEPGVVRLGQQNVFDAILHLRVLYGALYDALVPLGHYAQRCREVDFTGLVAVDQGG